MISATSQDMGVAVEYDLMERHEAFMRRKRKEEAEEAAVRGPSHYKQGNIECIDYLRDSMGAEGFTYVCEGNVKKYIHRWRGKNGLEDLKKAQVYLNWLVETVEKTDHRQLSLVPRLKMIRIYFYYHSLHIAKNATLYG